MEFVWSILRTIWPADSQVELYSRPQCSCCHGSILSRVSGEYLTNSTFTCYCSTSSKCNFCRFIAQCVEIERLHKPIEGNDEPNVPWVRTSFPYDVWLSFMKDESGREPLIGAIEIGHHDLFCHGDHKDHIGDVTVDLWPKNNMIEGENARYCLKKISDLPSRLS